MTWKRIGILGGTFDPPQLGHLILAEYTRETLKLNHMLFVPVADHPFKTDATRVSIAHRLAMLQLAIQGNPDFSISRVDIDRAGPHYSADTVKIVKSQNPGAELVFVMGGDNLREFPTWNRPREIYRNCRLAVMRRSDEDISPTMHDDILPDLSEAVDLIDVPMLSAWLSSTFVADRLRRDLSVRYLVPDAVLKYIDENELYR